MNRNSKRRRWLAGASLLAIVLGSGDANAVIFGGPEGARYIIPSTGWYDFTVAGADGGGNGHGDSSGAGALIGGELFLGAGETLDIVVGGAGQSGELEFNGGGGGGGGGSFVLTGGDSLLFAAGGGGGANFSEGAGEPGIANGGHPAGPASYGGAGGEGIPQAQFFSVPFVAEPAQSGSFPNGGNGASVLFPSGGTVPGPAGGYGGGGGGGYNGGGGGGGAPGGSSGQGGYSYVIDTGRGLFGITGGNAGGYESNGYVSIAFVGLSVPESSTSAMMLAGLTGLGWLAHLRRRKLTPT